MKIFQGTFVHSTRKESLLILEDYILGVDSQGKIVFVEPEEQLSYRQLQHRVPDTDVVHLQHGEFMIPGFVDTHIHASQYVYTGTGLDLPLLDWLETYTFPVEACYKDQTFASDAYTKAVERVLQNGTTTACYFATIHLEASKILADVVERLGQRAYVGKVNMDRNSPEYYIEDTYKSAEDTLQFVEYVLDKQNPLVTPVITPRFAPTATLELMKVLGNMAKKYDIPIQSHLSETKPECSWVKELFPSSEHYTGIYNECGLLSDKTVMAHCIYLSDREVDLMKEKGVGVSHCPNSNLSICSGLCDVQRLLEKGVKVGLGTDVSGGYSPSILNAIRSAVHTSNTFHMQDPSYKPLDYKDAFRLATLGGAQALALEDTIGNFQVGKDFDALKITAKSSDSPFHVFDRDKFSDILQKFLFLGDDRNITEVYVKGTRVC